MAAPKKLDNKKPNITDIPLSIENVTNNMIDDVNDVESSAQAAAVSTVTEVLDSAVSHVETTAGFIVQETGGNHELEAHHELETSVQLNDSNFNIERHSDNNNDVMSASMIARRITTEDEAKAALAERRRLAREEAERQAELERQRQEAEEMAEQKRQEEEEEKQVRLEEETLRLVEEQRKAEELRLLQAIEVRFWILLSVFFFSSVY